MRGQLHSFEYLDWALNEPAGSRYDLTASGMRDAIDALPQTAELLSQATLDQACRRPAAQEVTREFCETVAQRYDVHPDYVVPTLGASQAIMQTMLALVKAGDHVIVERPTFEPLHRVPTMLGADVSRLDRSPEDNWQIVPEQLAKLLTPKTRAVMLSHLHNPTGLAVPPETIEQLGDMASRVGAMVLSDEVYLDFTHDSEGKPGTGDDSAFAQTPACVAISNGVSWSSLSKLFGFSSLRVGWIVTSDPEAAKAIRIVSDYLHVSVPTSSLVIGIQVLKNSKLFSDHARRISAVGRRLVNRWLEAEQRVQWIAPDYGVSGLIRLPPLLSDVAFAEHLRKRYDTQVVPGSMFEAHGTVRIGFGGNESDLEQGLANFTAALDDLVK